MKYNKLVRDKVPEVIIKNGEKPFTHIAGEKEYWEKLKEKLLEETNEFLENDDKKELIDILEVIDEICEFKKINKNELKILQQQKANERGKFKKRIILDEVEE